MKVIRNDELPQSNNSLEFEGADHDGVGVSFFLVDATPGRGPSLHTHDYPEVFIMLDGQATFRGADGEVEVERGRGGRGAGRRAARVQRVGRRARAR